MKKDIIKQIQNHKYIAIATHINPDGDAIGSCTALALALYKNGKKPIILINERPKKYAFLSGEEFIFEEYPRDIPLELFIALDCGDKERLGGYISYFDNAPISINIDHHISNPKYGHYYYVDSQASSTSEMIYGLIKDCGIPFDGTIAQSIYAGIAYDTGNFRHSSTTSSTHRVISDLLQYDFDFTKILDKLFHLRSLASAKLLGYALNKMEIAYNNEICICTLTRKEMDALGAGTDDTEGIISFMKNIEGVTVAILIYEKKDNDIKVSFRSSGDKDVCSVAQLFKGGGHKKASGCSLSMPIHKAKEEVFNVVLKELF